MRGVAAVALSSLLLVPASQAQSGGRFAIVRSTVDDGADYDDSAGDSVNTDTRCNGNCDGEVTVDEITGAIDHALSGCGRTAG